jgi:hypothetical protein
METGLRSTPIIDLAQYPYKNNGYRYFTYGDQIDPFYTEPSGFTAGMDKTITT